MFTVGDFDLEVKIVLTEDEGVRAAVEIVGAVFDTILEILLLEIVESFNVSIAALLAETTEVIFGTIIVLTAVEVLFVATVVAHFDTAVMILLGVIPGLTFNVE